MILHSLLGARRRPGRGLETSAWPDGGGNRGPGASPGNPQQLDEDAHHGGGIGHNLAEYE